MLCVSRIFNTTRPRFQKVAFGLASGFFGFYVATNLTAALSCDNIEGASWYTLNYRKCTFVGRETLSVVLSVTCERRAEICDTVQLIAI